MARGSLVVFRQLAFADSIPTRIHSSIAGLSRVTPTSFLNTTTANEIIFTDPHFDGQNYLPTDDYRRSSSSSIPFTTWKTWPGQMLPIYWSEIPAQESWNNGNIGHEEQDSIRKASTGEEKG